MKYEELVRQLRNASVFNKGLAALLPNGSGNATAKLFDEAADAIESMREMVATAYEENANIIQSYEDSKPRWIPVTERLPEEKEEVLISDNSFFGGLIVAVAYLDRGKWEWRDDMCTSASPHPTHWMPMPQLPKE